MGVGVVESTERLLYEINTGGQRKPFGPHAAVERLSVDELHDHNEMVVEAESVMDRGDIGVVEFGLNLDFAQEPLRLFVAVAAIADQDLHGLNALGYRVLDLEDLTHAAGADQANHLVVSDGLSDF